MFCYDIPSLNRTASCQTPVITKSDYVEQSTAIEHRHETKELLEKFPQFMFLKVFVDANTNLYNKYANLVAEHNSNIINSEYVDAGFDVYAPTNLNCNLSVKVDFKLKCSAVIVSDFGLGCRTTNTGFYMYPRSSLSKTPMRLANSVGIIDSGYRGNLIGAFDCNIEHNILQYDRLVQICAPSLMPIFVELVESVDDLGVSIRGTGGFGSSGR